MRRWRRLYLCKLWLLLQATVAAQSQAEKKPGGRLSRLKHITRSRDHDDGGGGASHV